MAKKGTKKKRATKRKTATKTSRKSAARKTARKTGGRKTGQRPKRVTFRCASHTCKPTPPSPSHIGRTAVVLAADGTTATVDFSRKPKGSPFQEGSTFVIADGIPQTVHVKSNAAGHYPYDLHCPSCGRLVVPPEMIVP